MRRVHYKMERFPEDIQIQAVGMLGKGKYFKEIRRFLHNKGYDLSLSAIGRWAKAVRTLKTDYRIDGGGCPLDIVIDALRATKCRANCQRANRIEKAIKG